MTGPLQDISEPIDRKTSRSICDAVGELLRSGLRPDMMTASAQIDRLVNELRQRETERGR